MNDPTRMSCCERDAKNNEKNMKIYEELVKRDPTRIAMEKRRLNVGRPHECCGDECGHYSHDHECGADCHHHENFRGILPEEEERHWDDSDSDFSEEDEKFQMELVRKRMQSLKRRRVVVSRIEESRLARKIRDVRNRHLVVLYERSVETVSSTELLLSSLEKVCASISLEILHVVPRGHGVAEATGTYGRVRSKLNIRSLPALTCVTSRGEITGTLCGENLHRQFGDLNVSTELLSQWLKRSRVLSPPVGTLLRTGRGSKDDDDDDDKEEEECSSHDCGRQNCPISYYHEHIDDKFFESDIKAEMFMEAV